MTPKQEHAVRIAAWTWAAETLGIPTKGARLDGLVELTEGVGVENLKPALKAAMQASDSSFFPTVQSVISAGHRIAGDRRELLQAEMRDHRRRLVTAEAKASPASPDEVQEIRDRIEFLATRAKNGGREFHTIRPGGDDSKGIAAVREMLAKQGGES